MMLTLSCAGDDVSQSGDKVRDAGEDEDGAADAIGTDHPLAVLGDLAVSSGEEGGVGERNP